MNRLPVDADEQRMFDEMCSRTRMSPLEMVAGQLHLEHHAAPKGGSYRELKAIAFNVVMEAIEVVAIPNSHTKRSDQS